MLWLFHRVRKKVLDQQELTIDNICSDSHCWPKVTTQIPLYNEANVAERIVRAVTEIDYPKTLHEIQILDDSNDETKLIIDKIVDEYIEKGYQIRIIRRSNREGYKAGALQEGMDICSGDLVAIFDGDFVPPKDFLKKTVPYFMSSQKTGLVQGRWGHLNSEDSLLTKAQGIGIDGHFVIEQTARTYNGLFMNFNGTAGIWRKAAIYDAGGWESDTLTEDMDLSYRAQLKGWKMVYLPNLVVPAELPHNIAAFKSQQFRWAKGSIQTAKKIFPRVLSAPIPVFKKFEAFIHLTHYMIHPLMFVLALMALPVLLFVDIKFSYWVFGFISMVMSIAVVAPSILYIISQRVVYKDWNKKILYLPGLMCVGVGIAVSNTRAVLEALLGFESGFVRTPKAGDKLIKKYRVRKPWISFIEIFMGVYSFYSLAMYWAYGNFMISPFLLLYGSGFLYVGLSGIKDEIFAIYLFFNKSNSHKELTVG